MNIIAVNNELFALQSKQLPNIGPGDIVTIGEKIIEGKKSRVQKFQGIVISCTGSKLNRRVLLRKKFHDFWIEKSFFLHSSLITEIVIDSKGHPRRAVLSYLRKSKRLASKLKRLKK